jgi:Phage integrase, N-terminal SAM-like domain/Phage integrase family
MDIDPRPSMVSTREILHGIKGLSDIQVVPWRIWFSRKRHSESGMSYRHKDGVVSDANDGADSRPVKLLDQVRARCRRLNYSIRTERAYVSWIKRFVLANGKRHPRELGAREVEKFLTDLAVQCHVAASTQNQAFSALLFLYREVLGLDFPWLEGVTRAKRPQRLPVVLSRAEVERLLTMLDGEAWLMSALLYGSGMRLMECMRLRVKDIDFERRQIAVRNGKGAKDRQVPLPDSVRDRLGAAVERARLLHAQDLAEGCGAGGCRMRCRESIRAPSAISPGSMRFRRGPGRSIRALAHPAAIMSTKPCCSARSRSRACVQVSTSW